MGFYCWQDRERREDELNELHHLLEENLFAVTEWKEEALEKPRVCVHFVLILIADKEGYVKRYEIEN